MNKVYNNIHEAYIGILKDTWNEPEFICSPRGLKIREILNYQFTIENPTADSIITNDKERNKIIDKYTNKEKELYNSCSNKVEDFAKASKFWNKIVNPDGLTINSAYGYLIWKNKSCGNIINEVLVAKDNIEATNRTPWDWAKQCLIDDKDTRQAILRFSLPEHQWRGNKDQVCTMHGTFLIRNDKLYLSMVMRSNDVTKGIAYDLPWFCSLMDRMIDELKPYYPNLKKGSYTHLSHSMHAYEKDKEVILKMIGV